MKKILSTLLISLLIAFAVLITLSFTMRLETNEEKKEYRNLADSIALNISGQGISMPFISKSESSQVDRVFCEISNVQKDSCTLYVVILKDHKHCTVKYPCQVKNEIIYSVGLDYARETTFSLIEYVFIGILAFIVSFAVLATLRLIKS